MKRLIPLLFLLSALFFFFAGPEDSFAGSPDGTANNFINQNPFAFSMHKPGIFTSFDAVQYSGFNSVFNENGVKLSKPLQEQFIFIPAFIFTYIFLGKVNFFEMSFPSGRQFTQGDIPEKLSGGGYNIMAVNDYHLVGGGIGSPVVFYGIEVYNGRIGNIRYNFMPMAAAVIPNGWSENSVNNVGVAGFSLEPALTGSVAYKAEGRFNLAIDYAVGESFNMGHGSINYAEATQAAPASSNSSLTSSPTGTGSYTNPGNNFFADTYLRLIFSGRFEIFNETVYESQTSNYGWFNSNSLKEPSIALKYGFLNNGYQALMTGFGISCGIKKIILDARYLETLHAKNGPDMSLGLLSVTIPFKL